MLTMNLNKSYQAIHAPTTTDAADAATATAAPVSSFRSQCFQYYQGCLDWRIWYVMAQILAWILVILVGLFAIYVCIVLIYILCIWYDMMTESTIVFLFGRAVYDKNFPVCSNSNYIGMNCYVTTNTYCLNN